MAINKVRIVMKGMSGGGHFEEGILDTAALPGMHVTMAADGHWDPSPETAAELVKKSIWMVTEDRLQGKGVGDQYAIGDLAFLYKPKPGDHILVLVKTGADIAVSDELVAEGGGTGKWIEKAGTEAAYKVKALESSGGALAADTLMLGEWLGL